MLMIVIQGGIDAFLDYLSAHVLTCLIPAFFIAGAIGVFVSQASVIKYFGVQTKRILSYGVASVSGTVLAVCSCTVLPLFSGIYQRGAGIGPATAFLYSGPAINVLAIVYSARLLGLDLGVGRTLGAILFSIIIGLIMAFLFRKEEKEKLEQSLALGLPEGGKKGYILLIYFAALVGILVSASQKRWIFTGMSFIVLFIALKLWYDKEEIKEWLLATWGFVKLITPWLLLGVFVAGMIKTLIPESLIQHWLGGNSLRSNLIASIFGALMYFATLTEVPIIKAFLDMGMGRGPALALLLAGPALSLPSMIVIIRVMGAKKALTYILLVVIMATITGMGFGHYFT
ncbi:MAG: permease [Thermodesulfobacteriota bacterium]|nr:permease [Thermodesulfobacteriota bacterium]